MGVLNAGIAGNRILNDATQPFSGSSMLMRLERDALSKPGVRWIVLFGGINDITATDMLDAPRDKVTAPQIIAGMKELVARAHARGVRVYGVTLLPRGGSTGAFAHTAAGEAMRQEVNA